jgi:alpha-amylase
MLNGTILQCFHGYSPADSGLWQQIARCAKEFAQAGFSALWLPPMTKASEGASDMGYSPYDLYDLGEFDQCGSIATKYGDRPDLLTAIAAAQAAGLQVYGDVVLHRKHGGDATEQVEGTPVSWRDRTRAIAPSQTIVAHSRFTFPGRQQRYSDMTWQARHFQLVNHNCAAGDSAHSRDRPLYRLKPNAFSSEIDVRLSGRQQLGDRNPLICELDLDMPEVVEALDEWGNWFFATTGLNGLRLDGVKHMPASFVSEWLQRLRETQAGRARPSPALPPQPSSFFAVGDCWSDQVNDLHWYIAKTNGQLSLFDVPLHYKFHFASRQGRYYDLRHILEGTLMQEQPTLAVTFVENHNSQPFQLLASPVEEWFKPLAYALILLRREGYPCVFAADYYGVHHQDSSVSAEHKIWLPAHRWILERLLYVRSHYAYGEQYDYFERPDLIGWSRLGNQQHPQAIAVVISNGSGGQQWMEVGKRHTQFQDITGHRSESVWSNESGWGQFGCLGGSVSVWVEVPSEGVAM